MKTQKSVQRLFYALWPDDATRSALIKLQTPLQGRITPPEDLHLTLVFLGTQPTASLPALQALLAELPAAAIMLNVDCLGHFPKSRIAWAGSQHPPATLEALRQALLAALVEQNIAVDQGAHFKPHITLARNAVVPPAPEITAIVWRADHVALVQSTTTGSAPRYRLLASRRLEGV
ncbi:RNA 2',3'-cyclic phosphodiesterase [Herminiimonas sp. CN]|uniref:RNA 2',3'-cyclic phosphodiesterase n=1 Tax=Herminiimonas sp. CN TaxID=1349818 RepID=UPI000473880F|nr:RNA 2',3'-cyclic phosphodiesterase [Herminiimonas sp. CN]